MTRRKDITGQQFGKLTAVRCIGSDKHGAIWECVCDCGKTLAVPSRHLVSGNTKSCGHWQGRPGADSPNYKHGASRSRLHVIWANMKQRCFNPKAHEFSAYGGRGITVRPEWLHDFKAFQNWALTHGYQDDLTIDRIDNDKGYSPDNCRWATMEEQCQNKRPSRLWTRKKKAALPCEPGSDTGESR